MGAPGHASGLFENPQFVGFHKVKNHGRYWRRLCRYRITGGCMAYLQRLILLAVVLLSFSVPAFAYPATPSGDGYEYLTEYSSTYYPTKEAACAFSVAHYNGGLLVQCTVSYAALTFLNQWGDRVGATSPHTRRAVAITYSCPSGGSLVGSACVCASGFTDTGSACVDSNAARCADKAGRSAGKWERTYPARVFLSSIPSYYCDAGCAIFVDFSFGWYGASGAFTASGAAKYTGRVCDVSVDGSGLGDGSSAASPGATDTSTTPCAVGSVRGTLNGISMCSPPSDRNTVESIKSTTATNPVDPASAPGSGGSTTTQEATTCTGSKCSTTTTTTVTPAGGGAATVTVKTEEVPKDDYCTKNPRAALCLTSSFGGACAGGFACEGDAVQCATAREIHTRNCRMFDQDSPESLLYGTEKNKPGSQVANGNVVISSANFDTSDAIGGSGACITDKVVTVMGSPITIPFSGVCVHLAMLGNVLLTVSFLLAGRIFMRG